MATVLQDQDLTDPNNKAQNQGSTAAPGTSAPSGGSAAPGPSSSSTPAAYGASNGTISSTPQGSGSFTNLQKYLNANQQGGQEVAGGIGNNINNNLSTQEAQTNNYNQQLGQAVNNANQVAQQGAGYEQQLQGIGTNVTNANYNANGSNSTYDPTTGLVSGTNDLSAIQNFTNSPNFQNYLNIQSGNAINQNAINNQSQEALNAAQTAQQAASTYQNQLGNEGGRFALLQNTYGGANNPNYTGGLQQLDQAFLGQGNALGQVQSGVNQQVQNTNSALNQANALGTAATNVNNEATGLINSYNTTNNANQQAYINMLNSYIDPTNAARTQDVANLNSAIQSYNTPLATDVTNSATNPYAMGLTQQQLAQLGVTGTNANTGVYNVFGSGGNQVNNASQVAQIGANAQNAGDVASQGDVDRYNALMKITNNPLATSQLTGPSTIGASYTGNTDTTGLGQRLTAAQTAFNNLGPVNVSSVGVPGYNEAGAATESATIGNLLNKGVNNSDINLVGVNGQAITPGEDSWFGQNGLYNDMRTSTDPALLSALQNILNQQNYSRTIGGQRQVNVGNQTLNSLTGAPGTVNGIPITGTNNSVAMPINPATGLPYPNVVSNK